MNNIILGNFTPNLVKLKISYLYMVVVIIIIHVCIYSRLKWKLEGMTYYSFKNLLKLNEVFKYMYSVIYYTKYYNKINLEVIKLSSYYYLLKYVVVLY